MYRFFSVAFRRAPIAVIATILFLAAATAACDNPVEEDHDEHSEAAGFVLTADGTEILRILAPVVTDTLFVPLDDTTTVFDVELLDEEGDVIHEEDVDEDFELILEIGDANVAAIVHRSAWSFALHGLEADETFVSIGLFHVPGDHYDITPRNIPVVVR